MSFMAKNVVFTIISKESVKKKTLTQIVLFYKLPQNGQF